MTSDPRIRSIEAWHIDVPVTPFPLGARTITSRDYTVVRATDHDGAIGVAWGFARRAPIALLIREMIESPLLNSTIGSTGDISVHLAAALGLHYREGLLGRAASLVDIALIDLLSTVRGVPAWRLVAPNAKPAPLRISNVVGFEQQHESDDQFVARVLACVAAGYGSIKLAASASDPKRFSRRLAAIRREAPDVEILIDLDGFWSDVAQTVEMAHSWTSQGVAWIEDAVRIDRPDLIRQLHEQLQSPLAIGDEATSLPLLRQLADTQVVDVLRADLTCVGGLGAAEELGLVTRTNQVGLSFHAYPWIHQHAAAANELVTVESFELKSPFEVSHRFLTPLPTALVDGIVHVPVPTAPGLGVQVDWDFVQHHRADS